MDPNDRHLTRADRSKKFADVTLDPKTVTEGPEALPLHLFKKRIGSPLAEVIEKRTARNFRRTVEMQPYSHITQDEMHQRIDAVYDDAINLNPQLSALKVRGDKRILRVGGVQPTKLKREQLNLTNALSNPVYKEALDAVIDEMIDGVKRNFKTKKDLEEASVYVTIPKNRNRGDGMNAVTGEEGNLMLLNEILPNMVEKNDPFLYAGQRRTIIHGNRVQLNSTWVNDAGETCGKWRESNVHIRNLHDQGFKKTAIATAFEPDDGFTGMRIRHVAGIPTVTNIPLIIMNSIIMDNLNPNLKAIWKSSHEDIIDWAVGERVLCTDFSQFETTQEKETRHYVGQRLYSKALHDLQKEIDRYDLAYGYVDWLKNPETGKYEEKTIYGFIDRWDNETLAELFSPLLSGTGDTAVNGKALGLASALTYLSNAVGRRPRDLLIDSKDADGISDAGKDIRNCGDDNATRFTISCRDVEVEYAVGEYVKVLGDSRLYDVTIEYPAKYQGLIFNQTEIGGVVTSAHLDPSRFVLNNTHMENGWNHPVRSDEMIGLSGSYHAYHESLINAGWSEGEFRQYGDLLLNIIGLDHIGWKQIHDIADERQRLLLEGDDEAQVAILKAVELLQLKNAQELSWKVTSREIAEVLTEEEMAKIFIPIPQSLTTDLTRFLSTEFH